MREFKRGITNEFVKVLGELAATDSWWRDVLTDSSIAIFLRNECLNVYWQGQAIFKIKHSGRNFAYRHMRNTFSIPLSLSRFPSMEGFST
jgi:hypothetical protein